MIFIHVSNFKIKAAAQVPENLPDEPIVWFIGEDQWKDSLSRTEVFSDYGHQEKDQHPFDINNFEDWKLLPLIWLTNSYNSIIMVTENEFMDKKFKIFRQFNADGLEIDDLQDEDTEEAVDEAPSTDAIILRISSLQHTFNFN